MSSLAPLLTIKQPTIAMNNAEEALKTTAQAAVRDAALNAARRCIENQGPSTWDEVDAIIAACDKAHARYVRDRALEAAQRCIQNA